MLQSEFAGKNLPKLGFGAMRLPEKDGQIDNAQVNQMVRYAMEHGVNYFDTAWNYNSGQSERALGEALAEFPRESYYLADKYPGHQVMDDYDPARIFEEQLRRCRTDYFDFYLMHNVYENSIDRYMDPNLGVLDYFREQKRLGRIKHLGFSTHARLDTMERFLDYCDGDMEFCQIQLNYLDWTLQNAKEKYDMLTKRGIGVWVMEPVRGGKLANFENADMKRLRPDESVASWGFRFLQALPNVKVILSGMSNMDHVTDNVRTFTEEKPLSSKEVQLLLDIAERMKQAIPCTGCRYCCDGCPKGLDIPGMMSICSDIRFVPAVNSVLTLQFAPEEKRPSACIACGKCTKVCPQNIDIPAIMKELAERLEQIPLWSQICHDREKNQRIDG